MIRTVKDLIDALEFGLWRAEDPLWVAVTILSDDDGYALLEDLERLMAEKGENEND